MRLERLWLGRFDDDAPLELHFGGESGSGAKEPRLSFLVGANGSGKSRALECLGLIYGHLAIRRRPGLEFELQHALESGRHVLVTTRHATARRLGGGAVRAVEPNLWILTREAGQRRWTRWDDWPGQTADWLPDRVVGYSTGPNSRLEWALRRSIEVSFHESRAMLAAERAPETLSAEAWAEHVAAQERVIEEERQRALDRPLTTAVGAIDSALAVIAMLVHPRSEQLLGERRARIIGNLCLRDDPIAAFSLDLPADWREGLPDELTREVDGLLACATRRVATTGADDEQVVRAVFTPGPQLDAELSVQAATPLIWFEQLHRWWRRGLIARSHLALRKQDRADLLLGVELSDGEYLMAGRYALLLLLSEVPDLLVLLDEPETHFNDRWKVELVRDVSDLVTVGEQSGRPARADVVICTHSDLTLTDADRDRVLVFRHVEDDEGRRRLRIDAPPISPLAASRRDIMLEVFGISQTVGARASELVEGALSEQDANEVRAVFDRLGPGFHRFRLRRHLDQLPDDDAAHAG